jgi:hypothetical protein
MHGATNGSLHWSCHYINDLLLQACCSDGAFFFVNIINSEIPHTSLFVIKNDFIRDNYLFVIQESSKIFEKLFENSL